MNAASRQHMFQHVETEREMPSGSVENTAERIDDECVRMDQPSLKGNEELQSAVMLERNHLEGKPERDIAKQEKEEDTFLNLENIVPDDSYKNEEQSLFNLFAGLID